MEDIQTPINIGPYEITEMKNDNVFIRHLSGEGMETTKTKLSNLFERALDEFWKEEF